MASTEEGAAPDLDNSGGVVDNPSRRRHISLRKYLSIKLNCDPMRITKKFTSTASLGKSVMKTNEPPSPAIAEVIQACS